MEGLGQFDAEGCSTPFGIYEVGTVGSYRQHTRHTECSTPFGIYEVGTLKNPCERLVTS